MDPNADPAAAAAAAQLLIDQATAAQAAAQVVIDQANAATLALQQAQANANQAAAAMAAAAAAGPPQGPAPFALTPAQANPGYLDYSTTNHVKLYYKAIAPLTEKFDLAPANLRGFIQAFADKAIEMNWGATLTVPVGNGQQDLVKHYGSVTIEQVRVHATTYLQGHTRNAQNSSQIYSCLSESLTAEAKNKVALETPKFCINDTNDGLLYFKVIVGLAHIDTRATVTVIRTRLSSLDTKIAELQDNILELNQFVKTQLEALEARGETTTDLLVNLFKAYKACGDDDFLSWVKAKENDYNEGTINFTPTMLMALADDKYKTLTEAGEWMQKSRTHKRIVALTAQVQAIENNRSKKPEAKKGPYDKKGKFEGKGKKKANGKKANDKDWAWVTVAPAVGQPKEKDVNGKHFRWCTYHDENGSGGKWVQHTLIDCKVRQKLEAQAQAKKETGKDKMKVAGMVAVLAEDDDY